MNEGRVSLARQLVDAAIKVNSEGRRQRTLIKECGMWRPCDIEAVNAAAPDMVGFVVDFPRSRRSVNPSLLAELANKVNDGLVRVGVFVDEPVHDVANLVNAGLLDVVQLHGSEDKNYICRLRRELGTEGAPIMQAFRVRSQTDVLRAQASLADVVLLDAGQGSGNAFNWSLAAGMQRPFALAGGLGPENVAEAIEELHPWAVDMSSGLETDGVKDEAKIRAAVAAVRGQHD